MRKILFCIQTMVRGGVEKELITILKKLNRVSYNVTVLIFYEEDPFIIKEIPTWIKVVNLKIDKKYYCSDFYTMIKLRLEKGKILEAGDILIKRFLNIGTVHSNQDISAIPLLDEMFDLAVCYHIHSPLMLRYVAERIQANKKIGWIHNDFETTGYPIQKLKNYLSYYDEIVAVSNRVGEEFKSRCPEMAFKLSVAQNVLDEDEIIEKSKEKILDEKFFGDKRIKILTIGRFTVQKGIDSAIEICNRLKSKHYDFCWYIIGWGEEEDNYKQLIKKFSLEESVIILGKKVNPYPYIANCDVYVQPSRHEAWGLVVQEARILNRPIVCTNFAGANEQIINGITGYIVPTNDLEELENKIILLINNEEERRRLSEELRKEMRNLSQFKKIIEKFD